MSISVLITGGAGFIGSALARRLVDAGYDVAVLDVLHPQVQVNMRRSLYQIVIGKTASAAGIRVSSASTNVIGHQSNKEPT